MKKSECMSSLLPHYYSDLIEAGCNNGIYSLTSDAMLFA